MSNESNGQIALQVVGTVAGAVIGAYTGVGPVAGAQLGFTLGSTFGGLLFPPEIPAGPRIDDAQISTSSYGGPITINYGVNRLPGNLIWAGPIHHIFSEESVGDSKQTQEIDHLQQSFAMSFCKGPGTLLRLWLDNKLIYDSGLGPIVSQDDVDLFDLALAGLANLPQYDTIRFPFKFYGGTEEQERDPTMVAYADHDYAVEDAIALRPTATRVPAYRGLCYIVFDHLPLGHWGNRIPTVRAEIASSTSDAHPKTPWTTLEGTALPADVYDQSPLNEVGQTEIGWDAKRGVLYEHDDTGTLATERGLRVFSYPEMVEERWQTDDKIFDAICDIPHYLLRGVSGSGHLWLDLNETEDTPLCLLDPDLLTEKARLVVPGLDTLPIEARYLGFMQDRFGQNFGVICGGTDNNIAVVQEKYILNPEAGVNAVCYVGALQEEDYAVGACEGPAFDPFTVFYILGRSNDSVTFYVGKLYSGFNVQTQSGSGTGDGQSTCTVEVRSTSTLSDQFPNAGAGSNVRMVGYDAALNAIIFIVEKPGVGFYFCSYSYQHQNFNWKTWQATSDGGSYDPPYNVSNLSARTFAIGKGSGDGSPPDGNFYQFSIVNGDLLKTLAFAEYPAGTDVGNAQQFYDSKLQAVYVSLETGSPANIPGLHYIGRLAGDVITLAEIVADVCAKSDLDPSEYDVTQLEDDLVHGYPINAVTSGRGILEPLFAAYQFEAVESDYKLKFVKRGGAAVATIPQADLMPMDGDQTELTQTRAQERELPGRVVVNFIDYTRDYQRGTQQSKRISRPIPTQYSDDQLVMDLAIAMSPSRAARIAEITLNAIWAGRNRFADRLPWRYLALDPTDPVLLALDDETKLVRLLTADIGANLALEHSSVSEDDVYESSREQPGGLPSGGAVVGATAADVIALVLDSTLLNDYDDGGGAVTKYYQLIEPLKPETFAGGFIYRSNDGVTYVQRGGAFSTAPAYGKAVSVLPDERNPFTIQTDAYLDVEVLNGSAPVSLSDIDFFAGHNSAAVIRRDGEVEWVQFRDVTAIGSNRYRLGYLLRGRRGSEVFCDSHARGDYVVFFSTAGTGGVQMDNLDLGSIGRQMFFAGSAIGQSRDDGHRQVNTISGNDLKPYAPVHLAVDQNESGDWILTWVRRTRLGGEWRDGIGTVPLGEATELYEVDIIRDGDIVRSFTGITEPELIYPLGQSIADYTITGDPQADSGFMAAGAGNGVFVLGVWNESRTPQLRYVITDDFENFTEVDGVTVTTGAASSSFDGSGYGNTSPPTYEIQFIGGKWYGRAGGAGFFSTEGSDLAGPWTGKVLDILALRGPAGGFTWARTRYVSALSLFVTWMVDTPPQAPRAAEFDSPILTSTNYLDWEETNTDSVFPAQAGSSFKTVGDIIYDAVNSRWLLPINYRHTTAYSTVFDKPRLVQSTDGMATFTEVTSFRTAIDGESFSGAQITGVIQNGSTIVAFGAFYTGQVRSPLLIRSTDDGDNWTVLSPSYPAALTVWGAGIYDGSNFVVTQPLNADGSTGGSGVSSDDGATWTFATGAGNAGLSFLATDGAGQVISSYGQSQLGGATFTTDGLAWEPAVLVPSVITLPDHIEFRVRQISASVGAGFVAEYPAEVVATPGEDIVEGSGELQLMPESLFFGCDATKTVRLCNSGLVNVRVNSLTFSSSEFSLIDPPALPFVLAPGGSVTLIVQLVPTGTGIRDGTLTIGSTAEDSPLILALMGVATIPGSGLQSGGPVAFGSVSIYCETGDDVGFVINTDDVPYTITSIDDSPPTFTAGAIALPRTVQPCERLAIPVTFAPTLLGYAATDLNVNSDAPNSPTAIPLSGYGIRPNANVVPVEGGLNLGVVPYGETRTGEIHFHNVGLGPATIWAVSGASDCNVGVDGGDLDVIGCPGTGTLTVGVLVGAIGPFDGFSRTRNVRLTIQHGADLHLSDTDSIPVTFTLEAPP